VPPLRLSSWDVAVPTVEAAFGTKARLLKTVIDAAIAGHEAPVPMLERDWAARARAASDAATVAAEFAGTLTASAQRAAGLVLAAFDAARLDPDIAEVAAQLGRQRGIMAAWLVDELTARSSLRHGISRDEAIDTVWLLMDPAVFTRLTSQRKWAAIRFRAWFTDTVIRLLLDPGTLRSKRMGPLDHPRGSNPAGQRDPVGTNPES
jgi:TetR/AcrR family transcriptional regulator, regulator of autoinduction and epiphytic fitness